MRNGRFEIYLRRRQNRYTFPDTPDEVNVIVKCNPLTGFAEYVPDNVDNSTPYAGIIPVNGWYDFTDFIEGAEKLSFTWDKINSGDSSNSSTSQDGSNYDKGITSELMFFDSGYKFVFDWLFTSECDILNSIEVKIVDLIARGHPVSNTGNYRIFEIKSDNLDYAPVDEPCQFHIKLREQDNVWHCIHKTLIWDNWQHWFEDSVIKQHPCFLTCIEPRPRLIHSVRMALLLFFHSNPSINLIDFITGEDFTEDSRNILNANRFVDAPLIRTYIENVAGKCGLTMDTIFDQGQEWENLCLYYPQAGYMYESNDDAIVSPSLAYHFDNRWLITIAELFDKLKVVFAAEWYVTPLNKIVFKHKKDLINLDPIYDFTLPGAEPIYDLRYTFNGEKKPAYGRYEYTDDGSDLASQEISTLYNDIVDYDGTANNPMLEGDKIKNFEFAPTGFVRDGRAKDYLKLLIHDGKTGALILLSIIFVLIAVFTAGAPLSAGSIIAITALFFAWLGGIIAKANTLIHEFVSNPAYSGAVRLTSEQTLTPRLILWDGLSEQRAKAVATIGLPMPNTYYNLGGIPYDQKNKISEDNPGHNVYNYPLYFDGDFQGNLFPKYHDIVDNPLKSLETHQEVKWDVDLCETMLNLFGVFENQYAQIGKVVKLEHRTNYDVYVRLGNINVDYDTNKINLRGTVLRRRVYEFPGEGTIPTGPGGGALGEDVFPPGGDLTGYPPVPVETTSCLKWINNGTETAIEVMYVDCTNVLITDNIAVGQEFCSLGIISLGTGGNIVATDNCTPSESGSGSGSGSGGIACYSFQNLTAISATISYIDCNGNLLENVSIGPGVLFCGREITNYGACAVIINVGACDCSAIFPIRDSDDTMIIDADQTIVIWQ